MFWCKNVQKTYCWLYCKPSKDKQNYTYWSRQLSKNIPIGILQSLCYFCWRFLKARNVKKRVSDFFKVSNKRNVNNIYRLGVLLFNWTNIWRLRHWYVPHCRHSADNGLLLCEWRINDKNYVIRHRHTSRRGEEYRRIASHRTTDTVQFSNEAPRYTGRRRCTHRCPCLAHSRDDL